jgi:hypothetical protein
MYTNALQLVTQNIDSISCIIKADLFVRWPLLKLVSSSLFALLITCSSGDPIEEVMMSREGEECIQGFGGET